MSQGQLWIKKVRVCLKTNLYNNTAVYNSHNCSLIIDYAFSTHPTCYVDSGFCQIATSITDLKGLISVFDFSDFFSKRAIAQVSHSECEFTSIIMVCYLDMGDSKTVC